MLTHTDSAAVTTQRPRSLRDIDAEIGQRVRRYRMMRRLSQEKLGEHLGLTFQQVQKYEKGVNRIAVSRLIDISRVLAVPVAELLDGLEPGQPETTPLVRAFIDTDGADRALAALGRLTDPQRRAVLTLAETLADATGRPAP